jgi:hypothetical protein
MSDPTSETWAVRKAVFVNQPGSRLHRAGSEPAATGRRVSTPVRGREYRQPVRSRPPRTTMLSRGKMAGPASDNATQPAGATT